MLLNTIIIIIITFYISVGTRVYPWILKKYMSIRITDTCTMGTDTEKIGYRRITTRPVDIPN